MADEKSYTPPRDVRASACRGLRNRAKAPPSKRCCTPTGIARGRDLCAGRPVSKKTLRRMASFFARHAGVAGQQPATAPGGQAWDVWGGDAGRRWVRALGKAVVELHKVSNSGRPAEQLSLFGRPVQVREHVRQDASGVHLVHAHVQHRPGSAQGQERPLQRPPVAPSAAYVARGLKALQRAADEARHPDVKRALLAAHREVSSIPNPDTAAPLLERHVEALRATTAHPAAQLRAAGDRVAESTRTAWQTWRQQVAADEVVARRERLKDRVEMHDVFQPFGAPRPGERGYQPAQQAHPDALDGRTPSEVAATVLDQTLALREDPDLGLLMGGDPEMYGYGEDEDPDLVGLGWTREDLPDLFGVPNRDTAGRPFTAEQRMGIVEDTIQLAAEMSGEAAEQDWWPDRELPRGRARKLPRAVAELIIEDALQPELQDNPAPRVVLVGKAEAEDFVRRTHSKLPKMNARGLMYTIGLRVGGRLVAVATAGSPSGPWADPHRVLDVTRIASDGSYKGASSALMARLMELVDRSRRPGAEGPSLLVTYSLASEAGTTYRALADKGLRPVALNRGKKAGGARGGDTGALEGEDKIRWEYGPGAREADWSLLDRVGPARTASSSGSTAPSKDEPVMALAKAREALAKAAGHQQALFTAPVQVREHLAHGADGSVHVVHAHTARRKKAPAPPPPAPVAPSPEARREQLRLPTGRAPAAERIDGRPTLLSVFSGAGGETLGFRAAGFRPVAMVERNPHAVQTLQAAVQTGHLEGEVVGGDASEVDFRRWRGVDILTGGPPCQPFSKAGKLRGRFDPRDGYPHFLRAVQETRPRYVMAENVANLMSPRFDDYRALIEQRLQDLGYEVTWELVNAADYDVGQDRRRVLLMAWRHGEEPFTHPPKPSWPGGNKPPASAADTLIRHDVWEERPEDMLNAPPSALAPGWATPTETGRMRHPPTALELQEPAMTVVARHGAGTVNLVRVDHFEHGTPVRVFDDEEEGLKRALGGRGYYETFFGGRDEDGEGDYFDGPEDVEDSDAYLEQILDQHGVTWGRGEVDGIALEDRGHSIVVDLGQGPEVFPRGAVRSHMQTIKRAPLKWIAALQGFPRDYPFQGGLNAVGTQIGNAIPVELARQVGAHLRQNLGGPEPTEEQRLLRPSRQATAGGSAA